MSDDAKLTGSCMCGAVRYEASGKPLDVAYCHCESCRKHTGAPVVAWVAFDAEKVRFLAERGKYQSSPGVVRGFCPACGTPLTWEGESRRYAGRKITELHISTLDTPELLVPDRHWFDGERLAWFAVADNLPRYAELDDGGVQPTHLDSRD